VRDPGQSGVSANGGAPILVVDDDRKNLAALKTVLAPLGCDVVTAASGEEALRILLREDFAVILMDVRMPTMDGFETLELIKRRKRNQDTAVIFLTGVEKEARQVFRGYTAGAVDYISKPVDSDVLRSKVAVLVDLHRKTDALKESEERFRLAFANAPIGIALIGPDGEWLQANEALCDMLGRSSAELFRRPICEYTPPADREEERREFQRLIAEKPPFYRGEKRLEHKDGRVVRCTGQRLPGRRRTGRAPQLHLAARRRHRTGATRGRPRTFERRARAVRLRDLTRPAGAVAQHRGLRAAARAALPGRAR
jgi:PAS domain S-box-containing protein